MKLDHNLYKTLTRFAMERSWARISLSRGRGRGTG